MPRFDSIIENYLKLIYFACGRVFTRKEVLVLFSNVSDRQVSNILSKLRHLGWVNKVSSKDGVYYVIVGDVNRLVSLEDLERAKQEKMRLLEKVKME